MTDTAGTTLTLRIEPIGGHGPRRLAVLAGAAVGFLVSLAAQDATLPPTSRLVVVRRATGEVLARAAVDREVRIPLVARMEAALTTDTEAAFVERWCDPSTWPALARL